MSSFTLPETTSAASATAPMLPSDTDVSNLLTAISNNNYEMLILSIFTNAFAAAGVECTTYKPTKIKSNLDNTQTFRYYLQLEKLTRTQGMLWGTYKNREKIEMFNLSIALFILNHIKASPDRTVYLYDANKSKTPAEYKLTQAKPTITSFVETAYDTIYLYFEITVGDNNRQVINYYHEETQKETTHTAINQVVCEIPTATAVPMQKFGNLRNPSAVGHQSDDSTPKIKMFGF